MLVRQFADITRMQADIVDRFVDWNLTVSGDQLMAEGFKPGPAMGMEIEQRENKIFNSII
jgi:hypothetical protein